MNLLNEPVLFLATSDAARARTFYESVLGLTCLGDEPWALRFQVGGTVLNIQKVREVVVGPYTQMGWRVDDIEGAVSSLTSRGVVFEKYEHLPQDSFGIMTMPQQARIAWFKDTDGHTLSLTQIL